jgi:hypothetical protein
MCRLNSNDSGWEFDLNNLQISSDDYLSVTTNSSGDLANNYRKFSPCFSPGGTACFSPSFSPLQSPSSRNSYVTHGSLDSSAYDTVRILRKYRKSHKGNVQLSDLFNRILKPIFPTLVQTPEESPISSLNEKNIMAKNEKKADIKNVVNVLVASLTALDVISDGKITSDFLATITGYMMEEVDLDEL